MVGLVVCTTVLVSLGGRFSGLYNWAGQFGWKVVCTTGLVSLDGKWSVQLGWSVWVECGLYNWAGQFWWKVVCTTVLVSLDGKWSVQLCWSVWVEGLVVCTTGLVILGGRFSGLQNFASEYRYLFCLLSHVPSGSQGKLLWPVLSAGLVFSHSLTDFPQPSFSLHGSFNFFSCKILTVMNSDVC